MKCLTPIQASPEFIRDNQYNSLYEVVTQTYNKDLYEHMLEYHGVCRLMSFPNGTLCFFCKIVDK